MPWVRKTPWRRKRQSTPVFLPGESHRQRSLAVDSPWHRRVRHDNSNKGWADHLSHPPGQTSAHPSPHKSNKLTSAQVVSKKGTVFVLAPSYYSRAPIKPEFLVRPLITSYWLRRSIGFPRWQGGKEFIFQYRRWKRHRFDPWVRRIPWSRTTHSSILAWKIKWIEEPSGLQSMGS